MQPTSSLAIICEQINTNNEFLDETIKIVLAIKKMAQIVFNSAKRLNMLENILHSNKLSHDNLIKARVMVFDIVENEVRAEDAASQLFERCKRIFDNSLTPNIDEQAYKNALEAKEVLEHALSTCEYPNAIPYYQDLLQHLNAILAKFNAP